MTASSVKNRMDEIIHKYLPTSWHAMHKNIIHWNYAVDKDSDKYKELQSLMQGNFMKRITSIYQVQNPILYEQFQVKLAECSLDGNVSVKELLHCTAARNVTSIVLNNFDWKMQRRVKYGRGVSFSGNAAYAHLQSSIRNGRHRAMIVTDVIIGQVQLGSRHTIIPVEPYDTTVSGNGDVFVKYYNNEFYPKYVIFYEGCEVGSTNGQRYLRG